MGNSLKIISSNGQIISLNWILSSLWVVSVKTMSLEFVKNESLNRLHISSSVTSISFALTIFIQGHFRSKVSEKSEYCKCKLNGLHKDHSSGHAFISVKVTFHGKMHVQRPNFRRGNIFQLCWISLQRKLQPCRPLRLADIHSRRSRRRVETENFANFRSVQKISSFWWNEILPTSRKIFRWDYNEKSTRKREK